MKILCYTNGAKHQIEAMNRVCAGLGKHGLGAEVRSYREPGDCDLAVFWGHRQHGIISTQRTRGKHYLVMERGYIGDRFLWTSLGFDGLNGRAKFPQIHDGFKRWNKHFEKYVKPWRERSSRTAVIMGQVRGDESIRAVDFEAWVQNISRSLNQMNLEVFFRPHPGEPHYRPHDINVMQGTLEHALDAADIVVTYNSNSGVDAVLAGVPTYAADPGSMVWELSRGSFALTRMHLTRHSWMETMAYTQWVPQEIENGAAWEALRTVIDG